MKSRRWSVCLAVALVSLSTFPQRRAAARTNDLLVLSLEELLNVKVSVASTEPETIPSTPAIVSTYYMKDLMLLGARSLADALSLIPGVVADEGTYGITSVMIRGAAELANSQVLFLLDGTPYWSPSHSSFSTLTVPVEAIDRIEVIRGPGAVIYGSNAINGVINVITRSQAGGRVALTVGNNRHRNVGASVTENLGEDSWISASFEHQEQEGYTGEYRFNELRLRMPRPKEMSSAMVRYGNKNLHLLFHMYEETVRGRNPPTAANPDPLPDMREYVYQDGFLAHADYKWQMESSSLKVYTDYNQYAPSLELPPVVLAFDNDGNDNYRWRSGAQYSLDVEAIDHLSLLTGIEFERRSIGTYRSYLASDQSAPLGTIMEADSTDESAAYAQLDYWTGKWRYVAGARVTDNEKAGSKVTPRASVVYHFTDKQSLKLLYAVGFRSPGFVHSSIDIPGLVIGDPDLSPETITSIDLAYTYNTPRVLFVINAYTFDADDFVRRVPSADPGYATTYQNAGQFRRSGFEVDLKRRFDRWSVIANVSYNHEGDTWDEDDPTASIVPQTVVNVGASYDLNERHTLAATVQAVSERSTTDAYQVANITHTYRRNALEAFLSLRNITEEDPHNPDIGTGLPTMSHPRDYDKLNYLAGMKLYF